MRRSLLAAALLAPALALLAGCGGETPAPPTTGWVPRTLRLASHSDFRTLDPADPNFRGMADGLNILFLNAVFRGPAHARE